jgi:hypothetical protein
MRSGDRPGLQNRRAAGLPVAGAFDSHTLPPLIKSTKLLGFSVLRPHQVSVSIVCPLGQECGAPHSCPNVKLLGMWSWHAKAWQIAVSDISNSTFLRA